MSKNISDKFVPEIQFQMDLAAVGLLVGWCHIRNSAFKMYPLRSIVVVVKWSACLPFILTIQFSNPAEAYSFSVKFVFEKNENKQKEAGVGPFL